MHIVQEQDKAALNGILEGMSNKGLKRTLAGRYLDRVLGRVGWRPRDFKDGREDAMFWLAFNIGRFYEQDKFKSIEPAPKVKTQPKTAPKKPVAQKFAEKIVSAVALDNVGEDSE